MAFKIRYVVVIMTIFLLTRSPVEARFLKTTAEGDARLTSNGGGSMQVEKNFTSDKATA